MSLITKTKNMMKKKYYSNIIFCMILAISFSACQGVQKREFIIKKWQMVVSVEDAQKQIDIEDEAKKVYNQLPDSLRKKELEGIVKKMNDNIFDFKADDTFEFSVEGSPEVGAKGKWSLSRDGETLILTKAKGVEERFGITKLTEKEMIISNKGQEVKFKAL